MLITTLKSTLLLVLIFALGPVACSDSDETSKKPPPQSRILKNNYTETGDLQAIRQHGKLRILSPRWNNSLLPRQGHPLHIERELAANFAHSMELEPVLVFTDRFDQLIDALNQGKGDIIAYNLTITDDRKQQIDFTVPIGHAYQQLVTRKDDDSIKNVSDLNNRSIAISTGTTHEATVERLKKKYSINVQKLESHLSTDEILDKLANKSIDLAILDSNILKKAAQYRDDFRVAIDLSNEQPLAWGLRKNNPQLLESLNRFLNQQQLDQTPESVFTGDFDKIKQRKTLRLLTRNNAASYFLWRGELLGFEYELAKAFAEKHQLRLEVIVAPSHDQLIPMLMRGKGDVIAAFMTVTEERKNQGVVFSRPHHYASEILVTRENDNSLNVTADLAGRSVHVRRSSSYWQTLQNLQQQGINFKIIEVPETMETEEIIANVASNDFDLTVADSHLLDIELTWRDDIKAAFALTDPQRNAWAVRANNKQLLEAINSFIKKEYRGVFYNVTYKKYFEDPHKIKSHRDERIDMNPDGSISPYDELTKKYARQYGFDWQLLVAQMYQESRFDPDARSWAGARGLMQVMPRTAKELGFTNLKDPETGIHAGVKYLDWVRERFEPELDVRDRMWFTLAAYNAGQGHVKDARRLARQKGWNPNRWFGQVEKAMLLLSKREYARKARHGYVRGIEPVDYVRDIRNRFVAYQRMMQTSSDRDPLYTSSQALAPQNTGMQ